MPDDGGAVDVFLIVEIAHTHLYPGAHGRVRSNVPVFRQEALSCQLIFSDNALAFGQLKPAVNEEMLLSVDPYITAAGTAITAKSWFVALAADGDGTRLRILRRQMICPLA